MAGTFRHQFLATPTPPVARLTGPVATPKRKQGILGTCIDKY